MGRQSIICENTVFPEFTSFTSNEIEAAIPRKNFQIDKNKK
jgi:hypothetical protein